MGSYREDCNEAKAKRRGIVEQKPVAGKSKKAKPVVVEERLRPDCALAQSFPGWTKWEKSGEYKDAETAQQTMDRQARKYSFMEYRIRGEK